MSKRTVKNKVQNVTARQQVRYYCEKDSRTETAVAEYVHLRVR